MKLLLVVYLFELILLKLLKWELYFLNFKGEELRDYLTLEPPYLKRLLS